MLLLLNAISSFWFWFMDMELVLGRLRPILRVHQKSNGSRDNCLSCSTTWCLAGSLLSCSATWCLAGGWYLADVCHLALLLLIWVRPELYLSFRFSCISCPSIEASFLHLCTSNSSKPRMQTSKCCLGLYGA